MPNTLTNSMPLAMRISPIVESFERIRLTTMISRADWLDLLGVGWAEYQKFETGSASPSRATYDAIDKVSGYFGLDPERLIEGRIDFTHLALASEPNVKVPMRYLTGAFGRRRTTINTINFVEQIAGWRLRLDIKRKFGLTEAHLQDAFELISVQLITDICEYLRRRSFGYTDFFAMGVDTYAANRGTIIGKMLAGSRTTSELYEVFFNECMKLLEHNCSYQIVKNNSEKAVIEMRSKPDVAEALRVREVGSEILCHLKAGMVASLPLFIKRPLAFVEHTTCVHRGDAVCRFDVTFNHHRVLV